MKVVSLVWILVKALQSLILWVFMQSGPVELKQVIVFLQERLLNLLAVISFALNQFLELWTTLTWTVWLQISGWI